MIDVAVTDAREYVRRTLEGQTDHTVNTLAIDSARGLRRYPRGTEGRAYFETIARELMKANREGRIKR